MGPEVILRGNNRSKFRLAIGFLGPAPTTTWPRFGRFQGGGLGLVCGGLGHEGSLVRNYVEKGSAPAFSKVPIHRVIEELRFEDTQIDRPVEGIHYGPWNDIVVIEFQGGAKAQDVKRGDDQERPVKPAGAGTRLGVWNRWFAHERTVVPAARLSEGFRAQDLTAH